MSLAEAVAIYLFYEYFMSFKRDEVPFRQRGWSFNNIVAAFSEVAIWEMIGLNVLKFSACTLASSWAAERGWCPNKQRWDFYHLGE